MINRPPRQYAKALPEDFVQAANELASWKEVADRFGYTPMSAQRRAGELRQQGYTVPKLPLGFHPVPTKPKTKLEKEDATPAEAPMDGTIQQPAVTPPLGEGTLFQPERMAIYAAAVLDLVGEVTVRVREASADTRVQVGARLSTPQLPVIQRVYRVYGGLVEPAGEEYVLTWPDLGELHGFLSSVGPHSERWFEQIANALPYVELLALFRQQEEELIARLNK